MKGGFYTNGSLCHLRVYIGSHFTIDMKLYILVYKKPFLYHKGPHEYRTQNRCVSPRPDLV